VKRAVLELLASATIVSVGALFGAEMVQYPDNFRRWVHVETGVVMPGASPQLKSEEGMHHVFANEKAVAGYPSGEFADGSIIVYELREAKQQNGVIFEGDRKRLDVMIKDSSLKSTGGWRFERFWGDDHEKNAVPDSGTTCIQCHSQAAAHGSVFSQFH
jgi:Cytochrome P460